MRRYPSTSRIHGHAELALATTNNDAARAAGLLCEWSGLSFEFSFEVVEAIAAAQKPDEATP